MEKVLAVVAILLMLTGCDSLSGVLRPLPGAGNTPSLERAKLLYEHGLDQDARRELVAIVINSKDAPEKARALDHLARIAIDQKRFLTAVDTWGRLIVDYPESPEASEAREKLPMVKELLARLADDSIEEAAAEVYLSHADFWAEDRSRIFEIDTSWIPSVEAAIYWYDRIIAEFPASNAARTAYEEKMRTIIGWEEPGPYGESYGLKRDSSYLPLLESTFREYEANFPDAVRLQSFRFQVAQAHWLAENWAQTRSWLNEIIEKDGGADSFYKDLAERRLKKVEH